MLPHLDIVDNAHIMVANYDEISFQSGAATTENVASPFIFLVFAKHRRFPSNADQRQRDECTLTVISNSQNDRHIVVSC